MPSCSPASINLTLDEAAKAEGLYFPPDPASGRQATVVGNIGTNAGGPHCFKYGVTTNYVTGLDVVLADGRSVKMGGRAFDYPEIDFVGLMTGSEGTLGVITHADVRLIRQSARRQNVDRRPSTHRSTPVTRCPPSSRRVWFPRRWR